MSITHPAVIPMPQALALLARGVDTLATPLALTLGPSQGVVINERTPREIELLTDSYTIARRVISVPGRGHNLGSMLLRKRSEEHTSELQSRQYLVCRLLLEKKKHT